MAVTAAVVAATLGMSGSPALAQPQPSTPATTPPGSGGPVLPADRTYTVTLLTGDVVTVSGRGSACPVVSVRPAKPSGVQHRSCGADGHVRVVPGEVAGLVGSVLDESLFDVTALILDGYDDARTTELPLIVRPGGAGARAAGTLAAEPLAASLGERRALPTIAAVAGRQPKTSGADFIRTLTNRAPAAPGARTADAGPKVWLDRRVSVAGATAPLNAAPDTDRRPDTGRLDRNLTQISAHKAWRDGVTGRGSRVAVLDTGADFTHPDLVGQVVERADFTVDGGDAVDGNGHGTHVAATIAGTGAGAPGQRRGVAPDADLVIGKVLTDDGYGSDSQIIAGMEWAAARADVVNMSLGGWEPSDGTDPLSLAVDNLTAQHGTLFVVSAGNAGPTPGQISSPGAAGTALTVGAVDGTDTLAEFSDRGPLVNTMAAKPELVAPGVDIVAARATGTSMGTPVDARYTAASGTSMAAPHVAGAAALLAQRHPGWRPDQLKAALVGAAEPLSNVDSYAVGAGRLDAVRALTGVVAGQDVVDLGIFAYPQSGTASTKLSWINNGRSPVTLNLGLTVRTRTGANAPPGAVRLSADRLTVGRGGVSTVTMRVDPTRLAAKPGLYTATVTARTPGGTFVASTPVAFYVEPRSYDLALRVTSLPDAGPGIDQWGGVRIASIDDPTRFNEFTNLSPTEPVTIRVPAGRYSVAGYQVEDNPDTGLSRMILVGDPDVVVDRDVTLVADAGQASPVRATLDGLATEAAQVGVTYRQRAADGTLVSEDFAFAWGEAAKTWGAYAIPMEKPGIGGFEAYASVSLHAPGTVPTPFVYELIRALPDGIPTDLSWRVTPAEQAQLIRIDQTFHTMDTPGAVTSHKRYGLTADEMFLIDAATNEVPATRVDYLTPGYSYVDEAFFSGAFDLFDPQTVVVTQEAMRQYPAGSRHQKTWVRQPLRPDWYDDPTLSPSECQPQPIRRTQGLLRVDLVELSDQHQRFDCISPWDGFYDLTTRKLTLYRDGVLVGEQPESYGEFEIPQAAGDYRLTYDLDATRLMSLSSRVNTAWTFRSTGPASADSDIPVPLLSVDYALPLDAANKPNGGEASFTVFQTHGVARQNLTSFTLETSVDDGVTWQPVAVRPGGSDTFTAALPAVAAGQFVSLRIKATADGGSGIEQTIIRAYRGA
ncbi:S8 family serine peptidase [Micromonospora sp. NBC_01699]|uniref:S8 family serine peptidase n=1 Tax=Micromonospora sp. NBC_01699 TaxID=2975984 RepID=UPI002E28B554|nr:S8 family serine peptidase [Micromonospora sp. NBC_01699]